MTQTGVGLEASHVALPEPFSVNDCGDRTHAVFLAALRRNRRRGPDEACRAKVITSAIADHHQRFLKIDPGEPAKREGYNQDDDRKSGVVPGVEPRNPPKEQPSEEFVEQGSGV